MSVIGKLRVLLGLDSSEFVRGTNKAKQANEELDNSLKQTKNTVDATTASTTRHAQAAQQSAQATQQQTTQAQQATKKFNTLNFQIQQVARELPSLTLGPQMFFLAISNNLPMLTDEVERARKEYKELTAAGEKATPVWKQMLSGILSWQTALVVGITLLVAYGKEIGNFVSELFTGKKAFDAAEVAASNFHRAMTEGVVNAAEETTKLDLLYKAATDNKKSYEDRKTAAEELQSIYPAYFGNLATEQIMIGKAVGKYNDLRTAIVEASKARAAYEMSVEMQKDIDVIEKAGISIDRIRELTEKLKKTENEFESTGSGKGRSELLRRFGSEGLLNVRSNLKKIISETRRELNSLEGEVEDSLLKSYGGEEVWERIEKQADGNVLNYYDGLKASIKKNEEKALASLTVESPEEINEEARKAGEQAAAAAQKVYESTLSYSESENNKAIAALQKEQGAYGTTIAYMEKMLQLRREQETYAKSEAEYQQRKRVNDELQKQIELMKQAYYAPGSEADLKAQISALQEKVSRLDPIADRMRIRETMAEIKQLDEQIKNLPQNYKIEFEVDLKSDVNQLEDQLKDYFENDEFLKGLKEQEEKIKALTDQVNGIIRGGLVDSISGIGSVIAAGLSGNDMGAALKESILLPLAQTATTVGKQMIAFGVAGVALKKLISNPFLAIAAGTALVALGELATNAIQNTINQTSGSGSANRYDTFTGGGYNPGYSNNGAYRYAAANVALAGTNVTVDVKGALKGEDIALAVKKVTYNKSR